MRSFLEDCQRIETLASQIYQQLAAEPGYAAEVRSLFQALSNDERDHALQIDLALQIPASLERDVINRVSAERIAAARHAIERLYAQLDRQHPSEEEALRLAVELEQRFLNVHVHNALHFGDPRLAALFDRLGSADQAHIDRLRTGLKQWHAAHRTSAPHT